MKKLIIVESPAKARTIKGYLGSDFEVLSSKGHVRDLTTTGKYGLGVDIENDFNPTYKIITKQKENIKKIKDCITNKEIYLATDLDREGEAISWHLIKTLDLDINDTKRIIFNEITKDSILNALNYPTTVNMNLVYSQEARRILDRIIGFRLSSLLRNKIKSRSAGRVQSVALKLIVDRDKQIRDFIPNEYWTVHAIHINNIHNEQVIFDLKKYNKTKIQLDDKQAAYKVCDELKDKDFIVEKVVYKDSIKKPRDPYTTSKLQQEASNKLGFSPKKTMMIAQKLYEGILIGKEVVGLITYMRTDSTRMSNVFIKKCKDYIISKYGEKYYNCSKESNVKKKTKLKNSNIQDAHECIRPTEVNFTPTKIKQYLTEDEYKLYNIIWIKSISYLMSDAIISNSNITLDCSGYKFTANGQTISFDGYLKLALRIEDFTKVILPKYRENDVLKNHEFNIQAKQHFTQPPSRYTNASLIKRLEEEGIGRPSTYVSILDNIQKRGYVIFKNNKLYSTDNGELTIKKLLENFSYILDLKYTSDVETQLDMIAYGELNEKKFLKDFYERFSTKLEYAYDKMEKIYPKKIDRICPKCDNNLVISKGRFGEFIGCSNYPKCKYIEPINKDNDTGIVCPLCKNNNIIKKFTKRGKIFYGCSGYPKCTFALWNEPVDKYCPRCKSLMIKSKKGEFVCSNKECK